MSCSEEYLYMISGTGILEWVVVDGSSSVFPSAVDHLVEGYSDHTGRMVVTVQDRQLE